MTDVVVGLYGAPGPVAPTLRTVDQVGKRFVPALSAITTGDAVSFPNSDDIRHHVYSFSPAKTFELPLYRGVPSEPVHFGQAGHVVLGCNIHDRMTAHIYVLDTPWHGTTVAGTHTFEHLSPGRYRLAVYHPRAVGAGPVHESTIEISDGPAREIALQIELPPASPPAEGDSTLVRKFKALRDDNR